MQDNDQSVGEIEELQARLEDLIEDNAAFMQEHGLGMAPFAIPQTQIRVIVESMFPDVKDRIGFDILVHKTLREDMERAVEGGNTAVVDVPRLDVPLPGMGGAVDLNAFRGANRKTRREIGKQVARDLGKGK